MRLIDSSRGVSIKNGVGCPEHHSQPRDPLVQKSGKSSQIMKMTFLYYELQNIVVEINSQKKFNYHNVINYHVSEYMDKVIESILDVNLKPLLPDIKNSYLAHQMLYDYLNINGLSDINFT